MSQTLLDDITAAVVQVQAWKKLLTYANSWCQVPILIDENNLTPFIP